MKDLRELFACVESVPDKNGGDLVLDIISAKVKVEKRSETEKGISYSISSNFSNPKLYNKNGYFFESKDNPSKLIEILKKAEENNIKLLMRFEVQRKSSIEKDIPISELRKDMKTALKSVNKIFAGVYNFNTGEWILGRSAASNPSEDNEDIQKLIRTVQKDNIEEDIDTEAFFESKDEPKDEIKPQAKQKYNPLSDTQYHLVTFYFFISGLEKKYGYSLSEDIKRRVVEEILKLSDRLQKLIRKSDDFDHKDYSHTKARQLVFSYEEYISNLNDISKLKNWIEECYIFNADLINWTENTSKKFYGL